RRDAKVGSIHINVFRPFPEAAVVKALAGKKNVIVLERTDEPMAGDNPMGRDIRTALNKALQKEADPPAPTAQPEAPALPRVSGVQGRLGIGRGKAGPPGREASGRRNHLHGSRRRPSL